MNARIQPPRFKMPPRAAGWCDPLLVFSLVALLGLGLVMMTSASTAIAERLHGEPLYFLYRQGAYLLFGLLLAAAMWRVPLRYWQAAAPLLLLIGLLLLVAVLMPGVGRTVNGSSRWLPLGVINIQVSEFIKLVLVVYLASFFSRHLEKVQADWRGMLAPLLVLGIIGLLLLLEPDFGGTVVVAVITLGLLFVAGLRLGYFLLLAAMAAAALVLLAKMSPYRWERVISFLNPWTDPYGDGFQLIQSLIAFGRGEWLGVGLGDSVQKLFYLPEAHTDFVYAILAEELGLVGVLLSISLYALLAWRALVIGRRALARDDRFGGFLAYGIGLWFVFQAYVNIGVNMGVLPTKGLTLPFMSYGGSSLVVCLLAAMLLLRVSYENPLTSPVEKDT